MPNCVKCQGELTREGPEPGSINTDRYYCKKCKLYHYLPKEKRRMFSGTKGKDLQGAGGKKA